MLDGGDITDTSGGMSMGFPVLGTDAGQILDFAASPTGLDHMAG
jgi:hypothetical protein